MKGIPFEGQTNVLGAPPDWDEERNGPCSGLPVQYDPNEGFTSTWELDADELEKLLDGGKIKLRIYSGRHPPVALWVENKISDDPPPPAPAPS